jgi:predicted transcriptional regulator
MSEVTILRKQVKKFIDNASEKELELVYHIFEATTQYDWWDEISNSQKKAITKGLDQLDKGLGIPHKEVMKKYNKWLMK